MANTDVNSADKKRSLLDALTSQAVSDQADPNVPAPLQPTLDTPVQDEAGPINQGSIGDRGTADLEARTDQPTTMPANVAARAAIGGSQDQPAPAPEPEKPSFLKRLGLAAGGAVGYGDPSNPDVQKGGAIMSVLGRVGRGLASGMGTPEQKQIAEEQNKTEAELPLKLAAQQNLAAYHLGTLGINQQNADTKGQTADVTAQKNQANMLRQGFVPDEQNPGQYRSMSEKEIMNSPELEQKWRSNMAAMGLKDAETDKLRDMLMGQFPVDATTAALANRPDLAGKSVSMQMWKGIQQVLNAKGLKDRDLGEEGMWVLDRAGNKYHQISAVGPSVARAVAFSMNKPLSVIDENGVARYERAGDAIASQAAPSGIGAQSMSKQAQFNDVHAGLGIMRSAINGLPEGRLSAESIAALTMATRETDPDVAHQIMDTYLGTHQLTEPEKNFVVAMQQINERALSLRNIAGMGSGSDQLRAAIRATLPSAKSGDTAMMRKQLDATTNLVDNLQTGLVKTNTPTGRGTGAPNTAAPKATHRYNPATGKIEPI